MKTFLGILLASSAATCALMNVESFAQEPGRWKFVSMGSDGTVVSIDTRTIEQSDGVSTAWVQYVYPGDYGKYVNGQSVVKALQREEIHCRVMQSAVLSYAAYNKTGEGVFSSTPPSATFTPIVPDSVAEAVWRELCR